MFAFSLAGLVVGFAVGATGVGGGALMTPILILLFGISPAIAVGTDLLYAAGTKGFGVLLHRQQGTVEWRIVGLLMLGSVPASILTTLGLHWIGIDDRIEHIITLTLCITVIATGLLTLLRSKVQSFSEHESFQLLRILHRKWRTPMTVFAGLLLGVVVTLSSVGAGVIGAMILLMLYPRLPAISVVGTDLAHAVPLTLVAGLGHLTLGTVDFQLLGYLLIGSLPGIYLGTRVGFRLPDRVLKPMIAIILVLIAAALFTRTAMAAIATLTGPAINV